MDVRDYIAANAAEFSQALRDWLSIPSVSADPARHDDVIRSAEWLAGYLRQSGFPVAEVWETEGLPAVYAEWPATIPAPRGCLLYGHHDVQPADARASWETSRSSRMRKPTARTLGRGAIRRQGPGLLPRLGVRAAPRGERRRVAPGQPKVLIEGEEESGSPTSRSCCGSTATGSPRRVVDQRHRPCGRRTRSRCASACAAWWRPRSRSRGPVRDLHSGSFGGGVPNPRTCWRAWWRGCTTRTATSRCPASTTGSMPLTGEERELFARLPFDEEGWLADAATSGATYGEAGYTTLERIWARPTAEVNGLWGGTPVQAARRSSRATRTPSCRSAWSPARIPPTRSWRQLETYVPRVRPERVRGDPDCESPGSGPSSADRPPGADSARRARWSARSAPRCFSRRRGAAARRPSSPRSSARRSCSSAVGLDADRIHAPNEYADVEFRLLRGAEATAYLWEELAGAEVSA